MRTLAFVMLIVAGVLLAGEARGEQGWEVSESNVTDIHVGAVLSRKDLLKIPDGGQVTLYDPAAKTTRTCAGAYEGIIETCPGPAALCPWWKFWGCPAIVPASTRGAGEQDRSAGK